MPAKAFVRPYSSNEHESSQPHLPVQFSGKPGWTMSRDQAKVLCAELNSAGVRLPQFPGHQCLFDIQEVHPGAFAVLCVSHPEPSELESGISALRT